MSKIFTTKDGKKIKRVSRWIEVKYKDITPRHSLYDYSDNGVLNYFTYKGKQYALGQFMRLSYPIFFEEDDKTNFLSGYDCTDYYKPLLIEIHDCGECVRLYEEINDN